MVLHRTSAYEMQRALGPSTPLSYSRHGRGLVDTCSLNGEGTECSSASACRGEGAEGLLPSRVSAPSIVVCGRNRRMASLVGANRVPFSVGLLNSAPKPVAASTLARMLSSSIPSTTCSTSAGRWDPYDNPTFSCEGCRNVVSVSNLRMHFVARMEQQSHDPGAGGSGLFRIYI